MSTIATVETIKQCIIDAAIGNDSNKYFDTGISAIRILLETHCCHRCCLRFINARDLNLYTLSEQVYTYSSIDRKKKKGTMEPNNSI